MNPTCPHCALYARELREAHEELAEYRRRDMVGELSVAEDIEELDRVRSILEVRPQAARLLQLLMMAPGRLFTRRALNDQLPGSTPDRTEKVLDVYVNELRHAFRRLDVALSIRTHHGFGYSLKIDAAQKVAHLLERERVFDLASAATSV